MTTENAHNLMRYEVQATDPLQIGRLVAATGFFTSAEVEIAVELVDERLSKGSASGYQFVIAEENSRIVGYACFGEIPCTVGSFDLYWIVVDPGNQRSGIGKQLMQHVERCVRELGGRGIYADTSGRDQYASTRKFYESCGYQCIARLPDFYAPCDPKQIYWRPLS